MNFVFDFVLCLNRGINRTSRNIMASGVQIKQQQVRKGNQAYKLIHNETKKKLKDGTLLVTKIK